VPEFVKPERATQGEGLHLNGSRPVSLDLSIVRPAKTVRLVLDHPDSGEPTDAALILAHPYTARARAHFLARADESLAKGETQGTLTAAIASQHADVFALLEGVENLTIAGEPVTVATFPAACVEHFWMPEQIYRKYAEVGGFLAEPKATSSPSLDTNTPSASA
jgi:hypothetical protein